MAAKPRRTIRRDRFATRDERAFLISVLLAAARMYREYGVADPGVARLAPTSGDELGHAVAASRHQLEARGAARIELGAQIERAFEVKSDGRLALHLARLDAAIEAFTKLRQVERPATATLKQCIDAAILSGTPAAGRA